MPTKADRVHRAACSHNRHRGHDATHGHDCPRDIMRCTGVERGMGVLGHRDWERWDGRLGRESVGADDHNGQ